MKFAKLFFIAAMAATAGMTACSKDEGGKEESNGKKSVLVTVKGEAVESRTVGGKQGSGTVALTSGQIIFTNGQEIVTHAITIASGNDPYDEGAGTVGQGALSSGATFAGLDPTTQKVYLIGNSSATIAEDANLKTLNITQVSQSETDGGIDNVTIFGGAALEQGTENNYSAEFEAKPVISRMEIEKITAGGNITDYKVTGIFINRYYKSMTLLGAVVESTDLVNNLSDPAKYAEGGTGGSYVAANEGAIYDYDTAGLAKEAGSGKAYAYNCLALPDNDGTMISVVIRLSDIELTGGETVSGDRFLTIRNFYKDPEGTPEKINSLERGNIYTIADVAFDENDLTVQPEMSSINATVEATIMNWEAQVIGFDFD